MINMEFVKVIVLEQSKGYLMQFPLAEKNSSFMIFQNKGKIIYIFQDF